MIKIFILSFMCASLNAHAQTYLNQNIQPPVQLQVDDYPTISLTMDADKKTIDCTLDKLTKIYVCPGKTPVLVRDSGYGSFITLELTADHSSKIGNAVKVMSGDKVLFDVSSYGNLGINGPNLTTKDLASKIMTETAGVNGFLGLYKTMMRPAPQRTKGSAEFEAIVKEHLGNVSRNEELVKSLFAEGSYQVELDNGQKVTCERGTTRELTAEEKAYEKNSGAKTQCGSFRCNELIVDGKRHDVIMMFESNPQSLGSSSIHLIDENGSSNKAKIKKITSANSKMPLVDNSYFLDNPTIYAQLMGGIGSYPGSTGPDGQQVEMLPSPLPRKFSANDDVILFKNPYFNMAMDYQKNICKDDKGALKQLQKLKDTTLERLANAELVQFIGILANGSLLGQFIDPNEAIDIGCFYNGVYLNKGAVKNLEAIKKNLHPDDKTDGAISLSRATELFNKARRMDDIAWDYKQDGCYARAHLMARRFEEEGVRVDKVWIKGDLHVPEANISWNFHVAPIVYVEEKGQIKKMVIDPSLFDKPVTVEEWDQKMTKKTKKGSVITAFPFPENAAMMERSALSFSTSDPYLPGDNVEMSEEDKMEMAKSTMFQYKNIDPDNGIYNYPGMPQQ